MERFFPQALSTSGKRKKRISSTLGVRLVIAAIFNTQMGASQRPHGCKRIIKKSIKCPAGVKFKRGLYVRIVSTQQKTESWN